MVSGLLRFKFRDTFLCQLDAPEATALDAGTFLTVSSANATRAGRLERSNTCFLVVASYGEHNFNSYNVPKFQHPF